MFSWELADEKIKLITSVMIMFTFSYCPLLGRLTMILVLILPSPIPSPALVPPSYTFVFWFSVLKLSLQTVSTFRNAFLILVSF